MVEYQKLEKEEEKKEYLGSCIFYYIYDSSRFPTKINALRGRFYFIKSKFSFIKFISFIGSSIISGTNIICVFVLILFL